MDRPATPASEQDTDTAGTTAGGGDTAAPRSRALEIASAVVAVGATGAVVLLARAIEVRRETGGIDPRWWPELLGLLGLALAVVLLVVALVRPPAAREGIESPTREGRLRLGATVALAVVFVALWPVAGFLPTAPVFLCATTYVFGGRGWKPLVLYPLVLCGLVYLLFQTLLKVPL
ncbi:tripartite tricarboxylate transporter TctB family protein [Saccharomonospora piscinae]|uniref:tripartite tricarboxylate transporter TctB family protein n=1 Tax=Saccharomonospora piscinae TaxID=687388 RepID=UPI000466D63E|nr:tripartite tricarboxylate transporter TctB family protein [Saccharomonospora piscinae]